MDSITKAVKSELSPEEIFFTNFNRIDESELTDIIIQKLRTFPNVKVGVRKIAPYEDYYNCKLGEDEFTLVYDLNYGASIYAKDPQVREKLISLFNE